jgi:hypothetical protein
VSSSWAEFVARLCASTVILAALVLTLIALAHWDGKVNLLQVTDAREHTLEIRALASAADASLAWDLRCEIREKLVAFVQQNYPESLPRLRASLGRRVSSLRECEFHNRAAAGCPENLLRFHSRHRRLYL